MYFKALRILSKQIFIYKNNRLYFNSKIQYNDDFKTTP